MNTAIIESTLQNEQTLIDLILGKAKSRGVDAQITISRQESWEASVAKGSIEQLTSSVSLLLTLSIYFPDGRFANVSSNDLQESVIGKITDNAIAMAEAGEADPHRQLPPKDRCGKARIENLADSGDFNSEGMLHDLLQAESLAQSADPRVIGFERCAASRNRERLRHVNSRGVDIVTAKTDYGISIAVVARQNGEKQIGYESAKARNLRGLRSASKVAWVAVEGAVRGFGWRKARSGPVGVVFDSSVASELLGVVKSLGSGANFVTKQSYWTRCVGAAVASDCITIIDDPLAPGGVGSREFDQEGVQARPLTLVEKGRLRSIMTDTLTAGKLNLPLTGHAGGASNLMLVPGTKTQNELLAELGTGFLVTDIQGHGVDITAGTWSKGAGGFWIENGKISHPVQSVTLAGKLDDILKGIAAVGNDLKGDTDTCSPSLLIPHGLTLGGE